MNLLKFDVEQCFVTISGRQIANNECVYGDLLTRLSFLKGSYTHRDRQNLKPEYSADFNVTLNNGSQENQGKDVHNKDHAGTLVLSMAESLFDA